MCVVATGKYAKHEWVSSLVSHHEAWLPTLVGKRLDRRTRIGVSHIGCVWLAGRLAADEGFLSVLETYAKSGPFYIPPGEPTTHTSLLVGQVVAAWLAEGQAA